jgi:hypothetical protein
MLFYRNVGTFGGEGVVKKQKMPMISATKKFKKSLANFFNKTFCLDVLEKL